MATNGLANNSSEIWVWDPVKGPNFEHPGAIPVDDFDRAKSLFIYRHCGPFLAKISRAIVKAYDDVAGVATIIRQGGQTEAMPRGRVIHWCEGLLILQSIKASRYQVDWFTRDLEHLMNQQLAKMQQLTAHHYVQERLLNEVVTGAKYKDMKRITHSFRRRGLLAEDRETRPANPATLDEMMGFWKIDKIAGYMPPWEAFLEFGIYQDFYLVYWQHPFQHVDYCSTENGSCILGTTWEPDECLPPHLDDIRLREKRAWIKRRKDAGAQVALEVQKGHGSKKRPRLDCHSTIPIAKHRRDGRPLERDLFCWRVGHDFQPEKMEDNVRIGWPLKPTDYPKGYGVADPPGFCLKTCDCMDDGRLQTQREMEKKWLDDGTRDLAVLMAIQNFSNQRHFVQRRGQVSNQHRFEHLLTLPSRSSRDSVHAVARSLADEVAREISNAMQEVPLEALFDREDQVRIPFLAFQKEGNDYRSLALDFWGCLPGSAFAFALAARALERLAFSFFSGAAVAFGRIGKPAFLRSVFVFRDELQLLHETVLQVWQQEQVRSSISHLGCTSSALTWRVCCPEPGRLEGSGSSRVRVESNSSSSAFSSL
eukprot:symbB.v1.2.001379.t1/scaffold67.1/size356791/5